MGIEQTLRRRLGSASPWRDRLPPRAIGAALAIRRRLPRALVEPAERLAGFTDDAARPPVPDTPTRLWVGPVNYAGQGHRWARAAVANLPGVGATSMAVAGGFDFPVDYLVGLRSYLSTAWGRHQERHLAEHYTHVLIEAERPVTGLRYGLTCAGELGPLTARGMTIGLISHGSDIRRPERHADTYPDSPFREDASPWRGAQAEAERNLEILAAFDGPVYVSTPDLLDEFAAAQWCPVVIDIDAWTAPATTLERERPVVVHVPSSSVLKGSHLADPVLQRLHDRGLIEYRSLRGLTPSEVRRAYADADIVAEQFTMGLYGAAAVEAMALGRVVLGFVDTIRDRVESATGRQLPIVEATPATLEDAVLGLLADRDTARRRAEQGQEYARAVHDGRMSAAVLSGFLT